MKKKQFSVPSWRPLRRMASQSIDLLHRWSHQVSAYSGFIELLKVPDRPAANLSGLAHAASRDRSSKKTGVVADPSESSSSSLPARTSGLINKDGGIKKTALNAGELFLYGPASLALASDPLISLSVSPESASEINGLTNIVYTFTRTGPTTSALTVYFNVSGTATLDTDYAPIGAASFTATSGSVTFAPGAATASVAIAPKSDQLVELDEIVSLTLVSGTGYSIGTTTAVNSTILNAGIPLISVSASPGSVVEDGGNGIVYTLTRHGNLRTRLSVPYYLYGTASFASDYSLTLDSPYDRQNIAEFLGGEKYSYVTVNPIADGIGEEDESVILWLAPTTSFEYVVVSDPALSSASGIILNDDPPAITLAVYPPAVSESGIPNLVYTFTRTGSTSNALTVNFAVSGSAIYSMDYTQSGATSFSTTSGSVTFAAGLSTTSIALDPTSDGLVESDETTVLTLSAGTGYTIGTPTAVIGTILQGALPAISLSVSPGAVNEDGSSNLIYTFKRTGPTSFALPVKFAVGGTATYSSQFIDDYRISGADSFSSTSGVITFASGSDTAVLTIDPKADSRYELNETVSVSLVPDTAYTINTSAAVVGTIVNDDLQSVSISTPTVRVLEDGAENIVFYVKRSQVANDTLTVNLSVGGTATFGSDYSQTGAASFSATAATVTFLPGVAEVAITLDPLADVIDESDETVTLMVAPGSGYKAGSAATSTIYNVFPPVSVQEDGSSTISFPYTLGEPSLNTVTITLSLGGTATPGADYILNGIDSLNGNTATFSFLPGATSKTITLDPVEDSLIEADETAVLRIVAVDGVEFFDAPSTCIILNDDPRISLAVSPVAGVLEDGSANLLYTFSRTGQLTNPLTVNFTMGGTATFGTDFIQSGATTFTATNGTVTFLAGASTATVIVDPSGDANLESNETLLLTLASGSGYFVGTSGPIRGTIINDDVVITLAVSPASVRENGSSNLVYTFSRSGSSADPLSVRFAVAGTATFNSDYSQSGATSFGSAAGTITFAAGSSTAMLTINPTADLNGESDETISLTLLADPSYKLGTTSAVSATILNDDLIGTSSADTITGRTVSGFNSFPEYISGLGGNDTIRGGSGIDTIVGGAGADTFVYGSISESSPNANDRIDDFTPGSDKIDLSRIDSIPATTTVNDAFVWVGSVPASSITPGRAGYSTGPGGVTLFANTGTIGSTSPDFRIDLPGVSALAAADIML